MFPFVTFLFALLILFVIHFVSAYQYQSDNSKKPFAQQRSSVFLPFSSPKPIDGEAWPHKFPAKEHCSKCGLCETSFVSEVATSCPFLYEGMSRIDRMEEVVHGRARDNSDIAWSESGSAGRSVAKADEARFGVMYQPMWVCKGTDTGAQWSGVVTGIAISMLESKMVDAVVCISSKQNGHGETGQEWSEPEPIIAKTTEEVLSSRGVKPCLAPSLKVLDDIKADSSIKKLLFCGVGCSVQAFRAVEAGLGLEEVFVLGTNCADNSPTPEAARDFVRRGLGVDPNLVRGYEFMPDFRVHVKLRGAAAAGGLGGVQEEVRTPYFCLPPDVAEGAIAPSCRACFDYTNALADAVVGYMAAPDAAGRAWAPGFRRRRVCNCWAAMLAAAAAGWRVAPRGPGGGRGRHERARAGGRTAAADGLAAALAGRPGPPGAMPRRPAGEAVAEGARWLGPKGVAFARYSVDYHVLRNYLHVLGTWGEARAGAHLPRAARAVVAHYLETDAGFAELRSAVLRQR
ncbi:unnamed protein product, partial [Heterosigma akashiwo]